MARVPERNLRDGGGHSRLPTFPTRPWAVCVPISHSLLSSQAEARTTLPPSTQLARWEGGLAHSGARSWKDPGPYPALFLRGVKGSGKDRGSASPRDLEAPLPLPGSILICRWGCGGVRPSSLGTRVSGHGHHSSCFPPLRHRSCCSRELGEVPSIHTGTLPTVPRQRHGPWPAGI